ncbi:hypothetical protein [Flavihumibacter sp. UBA7668]|uniref:hypothetical protein n=1 Tax=Flavihumibacter sp. UBA7668 TaxID=1946542 RepID=UPI0025BA1850|nr:hypothetical protein [Flavihumibacter sp. UBA7668]
MKSEQDSIKRFSKSHPILRRISNKRNKNLRLLFREFQPDDFQKELNRWLTYALSNNQSAYDDGCLREELIEFVIDLGRLMEAYSLQLNSFHPPASSRLTDMENLFPELVISEFRTSYSAAYAQSELFDLLDAVITYDGIQKVYKGNLVILYHHFLFMLQLTYRSGPG